MEQQQVAETQATASPKKGGTELFAFYVRNDTSQIGLKRAKQYGELRNLLDSDDNVGEVTMILRGREIKFQTQTKIKFHV